MEGCAQGNDICASIFAPRLGALLVTKCTRWAVQTPVVCQPVSFVCQIPKILEYLKGRALPQEPTTHRKIFGGTHAIFPSVCRNKDTLRSPGRFVGLAAAQTQQPKQHFAPSLWEIQYIEECGLNTFATLMDSSGASTNFCSKAARSSVQFPWSTPIENSFLWLTQKSGARQTSASNYRSSTFAKRLSESSSTLHNTPRGTNLFRLQITLRRVQVWKLGRYN